MLRFPVHVSQCLTNQIIKKFNVRDIVKNAFPHDAHDAHNTHDVHNAHEAHSACIIIVNYA